jgi:hypothetical protein
MGMGVRFTEIDPENQSVIEEYVSKVVNPNPADPAKTQDPN